MSENPFVEALERAEKMLTVLYGGLNDIETMIRARDMSKGREQLLQDILACVKRTREQAHK